MPQKAILTEGSSRDYNIGWRLTAEADAIEDSSFDLKATRSESNGSQPDHRVDFELRRAL